jgi:N-acetylglucosaminyldiphosphoundecaprenol N-acetyl-beta-D-mannosaminyltransferase
LLFVAFGSPRQETWIAKNLPRIPNVKRAIGVGGSFDFLSGRVRRAPRWLQRIGLEWFWRLLVQPWRAGRIVTATIRFPLYVLRFRTNVPH